MNTNHGLSMEDMIRIGDTMSAVSRIDVPKMKQTIERQGDLIRGIRDDLIKLANVYKKHDL